MSKNFAPGGADGRAVWRSLYDLLRHVPVGQTVTYEVLEARIGRTRAGVQSSMGRAAQELLRVDKHAVVSVRDVGYRVVSAAEHLDIARDRQRRSHRELKRGRDVVTNVDLNGLDAEVRDAFDRVTQAFAIQLDYARRLGVRSDRLEQQLNAIHPKVDRTADEVAALKKRLENMEKRVNAI